MIAGLPGTGIGLTFFVITALLSPLWELVVTARRRSSRQRWLAAFRISAIAALVAIGIGTTTFALVLSSRLVRPANLSPGWQQVSDVLVLALFGTWALSAMAAFVGFDVVRYGRRRVIRYGYRGSLVQPDRGAAASSDLASSDNLRRAA
ncbi:MAG: hypothetical protein HY682_05740 [Chloroflexi bacterium]|nr:hypothetical protein [Chloroflexota bacterium]